MKRFNFLLLAATALFASCNDDNHEPAPPVNRGYPVFVHSYIGQYIKTSEWETKTWYNANTDEYYLQIEPKWGDAVKYYIDPLRSNKECPEFETIAARNGDTTYDREVIYFPYPGFELEVCADNYKSVSVVCPDGDWDEQHPANTSLNDLVKIEYETYACFVDGKYSEDALEFEHPTKLLTRLGENDLRMIQPSLKLYIKAPATEGLELKITLTTVDGEEQAVEFNAPRNLPK